MADLDLNMKPQAIRELSSEEISELVMKARAHLLQLRFQRQMGELTDVSQFRKTRRLIARLLTVLRERELQGESTQPQERA